MVGFQVSGLVAARIAAHAISDHQGAGRCQFLVTSRRVRPMADTSPCELTTAPSSRASQACFCAVADSIEPTPSISHTASEVLDIPRGNVSEVLCRDVHYHPGAVLTRAVLRCGVEEDPRHIQQCIRIAIRDPGCGLLLRVAARIGLGWRWAELWPFAVSIAEISSAASSLGSRAGISDACRPPAHARPPAVASAASSACCRRTKFQKSCALAGLRSRSSLTQPAFAHRPHPRPGVTSRTLE